MRPNRLLLPLLALLLTAPSPGQDSGTGSLPAVQILVADLDGPAPLIGNPTDILISSLAYVAGGVEGVQIEKLYRPLSPDNPVQDAESELGIGSRIMVVFGEYDCEGSQYDLSLQFVGGYGFDGLDPWRMTVPGINASSILLRSYGSAIPGSSTLLANQLMDVRQIAIQYGEPQSLLDQLARTLVGIALHANRHPEEAAGLLESAIALADPESEDSRTVEKLAWFYLGLSRQDTGDTNGAEESFEAALEIDPACEAALIAMAQLHHAAGEWEAALDAYDKALALRPDLADLYADRGLAYCHTGRQEQGIADLSTYLEAFPDDAMVLYNRGYAYYETGNFQQAIDDFCAARELMPRDPGILLNLGHACFETGRWELAIDSYTEAIEVAPREVLQLIYYRRALCHLDLNDPESAIEDLTSSLDLDPYDVDSYWNRARAYYLDDQPEASLGDLERLLALDPSLVEPYYWRGVIHQEMGDIDQARSDFQYVKDNATTFDLQADAIEALEQLSD